MYNEGKHVLSCKRASYESSLHRRLAQCFISEGMNGKNFIVLPRPWDKSPNLSA